MIKNEISNGTGTMLTKKNKLDIIKAISNTDAEKLATARHESAHAVVFLHLGIPITSIDLNLEVKSDGNGVLDITTGKINAGMSILPQCFEAAAHGNKDAFEFIKKSITCNVAGAIYDECVGESGYSGDIEAVRVLSMRACGENVSKAKSLTKTCISDAQMILQENDAIIERLAKALVAKGRLDGSEVKAIADAA